MTTVDYPHSDYTYNFRSDERQSARLTVIEHSQSDKDALHLLQILGLDSLIVPREYLPIGKP